MGFVSWLQVRAVGGCGDDVAGWISVVIYLFVGLFRSHRTHSNTSGRHDDAIADFDKAIRLGTTRPDDALTASPSIADLSRRSRSTGMFGGSVLTDCCCWGWL